MSDPVLYRQQGRVAIITLNRPDTRNALSDDLVPALIEALNRANDDAGVSCVVLTGEGKSFSSGGNLKEIRAMTQEKKLSTHELRNWYVDMIQQIPRTMAELTVPVIAAVNGHAIGAGCDLTMMCDIRIASEKALFAESFMRVGLIPGDGGAWFLPRVIGLSRACEMSYTCDMIDAQKADKWGMVSDVVTPEDLMDTAIAMAERIAAHPPLGVRYAKKLITASQDMPLNAALEMAAGMQATLQNTDDHLEAIDAALEKRAPVFKGA
ncbi:MAG: crotonase/enoyl-CoA hydratase family protein [Porticoccaceae bacterium]|nr:crotonase/enoyl-CoA hydratase family protein [Porticoccaceae bacterium]